MTEEHLAPDARDPTPQPDVDRQRIQWLSERSGEVELLISGALLFGLLQVPGRMEGWWDGLLPGLNNQTFIVAFLLYFYVRIMVFTMIAAFSLHLVTRAYWVGLVGLDSVFPEGVNWDQVKYGPVSKKVYQDRLPSLPFLARRADDVGSAIFSVAFYIITIFVFSIAFGVVFGGISWVLSRTVLPSIAPTTLLVVFAMVIGTIPLFALTTEKLLGDRLDPDGRMARIISGALLAYYRLSGGALYMPIQFTLFSRIEKRIVWPASIMVFVGLFAILMVTETTRTGIFAFSPDAHLPDRPGPRSVSQAYFEATRSSTDPFPYIQSDVIEGPYVRLTIPLVGLAYLPRLHRICPDLDAIGSAGLIESSPTDPPPTEAEEAALLDCLGQIWSVRLDGAIASPEWDLLWSGNQGPSAIVTYIATQDMASGTHLIKIERIPSSDPDETDEEDELLVARYFIRFRI